MVQLVASWNKTKNTIDNSHTIKNTTQIKWFYQMRMGCISVYGSSSVQCLTLNDPPLSLISFFLPLSFFSSAPPKQCAEFQTLLRLRVEKGRKTKRGRQDDAREPLTLPRIKMCFIDHLLYQLQLFRLCLKRSLFVSKFNPPQRCYSTSARN